MWDKIIAMKNSGFTMIELIVVIALISILSIPMARFVDVGVFKVKSKDDVILSFIQSAQKIAIAQRKSIYVLKDGNKVKLCYISGTSCTDSNTVKISSAGLFSLDLEDVTIGLPSGFGYSSNGVLLNNQQTFISLNGVNKIIIEMGTGYAHH